jgi:hypothetical protein
MFRAVHVLQIDPEQRVRKPARLRGQAEVDVYDERSNQGEDDAEAEGVETSICVRGPDCAVAVWIKEVDVLLENGLVRVFGSPGVFRRAVGVGVCGCDVDACDAYITIE